MPLSVKAEAIDANRTAVNECIQITDRENEYGKFGSKSRGLSVGTHVSYILLSMQELNEFDYSKSNAEHDKSIFQICSNALLKFGYKSQEYIEAIQEGYTKKEIIKAFIKINNFIRILDNEVSAINSNGGLVVFVAWGKSGKPQ